MSDKGNDTHAHTLQKSLMKLLDITFTCWLHEAIYNQVSRGKMNKLQMNRFPLLKQLWVYMNHGFKVLKNKNNKSYKFNVSAFVFLDIFWSVLPTAMLL